MEESISQAAGSEHGDHIEVEDIQRLIHEIDRVPYERTTVYGRREHAARAAPPRELAGVQVGEMGAAAVGTGY